MLVGYARTSSLAQVAGLEAQERELRTAGCDKIFRKKVSSVAQREQLEQALDYVREGDQFSFARSWTGWRGQSAICWRSSLGLRPRTSLSGCCRCPGIRHSNTSTSARQTDAGGHRRSRTG